MSAGFWPVLAIIVIVILWVLSEVRYYIRKSDAQWNDVDKSKLREWEDEDD